MHDDDQQRDEAGDEVVLRCAWVDAMVELCEAQRQTIQHLSRSLDEQRVATEDHALLREVLAHELRTPMTIIAGALETLRALPERSSPVGERMLDMASGRAQQLQDLIEDVLALSELRRVQVTRLPAEEVSLHALIEDVRGLAAVELDPARLQNHVPFDLVVTTARTRLRRVLLHLVLHLHRGSSRAGPVAVRARRTGGTVRIEVADCAPSAPAPHAGVLAEWSGQGLRSEPRLGLALYVVGGLVASLGGSVSLRTGPAGGTVAALQLPQRRGDDQVPRGESTVAAGSRATSSLRS